MADMVERARALGVYTVVTDNRPYEVSPAKQIADAWYNISFSDIGKLFIEEYKKLKQAVITQATLQLFLRRIELRITNHQSLVHLAI